MRSKAPLALMEQMIMLLVFALAAALCLQSFAKSDRMSERAEERDRALTVCQSAAEVIRHTGGDFTAAAKKLDAAWWDADGLTVDYDQSWESNASSVKYVLGISRVETGVPGLGRAEIWLYNEAAEPREELIRFQVAWQEVSGDA